MTKKELIEILETFPDYAEILIDLEVRYAELKGARVEYSRRPYDINRCPYVIIEIYR